MIQKCIAASAPSFLVGTLTTCARSKTPSSSTIQRSEISLDAGLALWSKRHYLEDAVRACWLGMIGCSKVTKHGSIKKQHLSSGHAVFMVDARRRPNMSSTPGLLCCLDGFVLVSALLASLRLVCFLCVFCSLRSFVADERDLGLAMTHGP